MPRQKSSIVSGREGREFSVNPGPGARVLGLLQGLTISQLQFSRVQLTEVLMTLFDHQCPMKAHSCSLQTVIRSDRSLCQLVSVRDLRIFLQVKAGILYGN